MSETVCQVLILIFGGGGVALIARGGNWAWLGFALGLASVPFWTLSASRAGQWAMIILNCWFGGWYGIGTWRRLRARRPRRLAGRRVVRSYDPETWPYPPEEDAQREWDEIERADRRLDGLL